MPSEARQKKIMEKLNRAQKCSILGPQNLGSRGGPDPRPPPRSEPGSCRRLPLTANGHFCVPQELYQLKSWNGREP